MSLKLSTLTFDCADPELLAEFWSAALHQPMATYSADFASVGFGVEGFVPLLFLRVPEPKQAKNRFHFDLSAADREAEVARLIDLGAQRLADHRMAEFGAVWTVMQDPEGNEFCVTQRRR